MAQCEESACNAGATEDAGLIPELGRSPGGGCGNLLQYSCLKNPKDRGARCLQSTGSQSWTQLEHWAHTQWPYCHVWCLYQQDHRAESAPAPPGPSFLTLELIPGVHYQKICSLVWQLFLFPTLAWNHSFPIPVWGSPIVFFPTLWSLPCEPQGQPCREEVASQSPEIHPSWGEAWSFRFR